MSGEAILSETPPEASTIWQALDAWADSLVPWQQYITHRKKSCLK